MRDPGDPAQSAAQSGLLAPVIARSPWFLRIPLDAFQHFLAADGWAIASYIAFAILAAMFPFLILVNALAGAIGSSDLGVEAGRILLGAWPREVAAPIAGDVQEVQNAVQNAGHSSAVAVGAALAVYFASNGIESLRIGLNRAYGVMETRSWWLLRAESTVYVLVSAIALLVVAVLVVLAPLLLETAVRYVQWLQPLDRLGTVARLAVASAVLVVALVLLHLFLPAGRRRIRQILPGVVVTIMLWLAGGAAFGLYLAQYANRYVTTYAGLASAMIALVFLYLSAAIFIYGGELNAAILRARRERAVAEAKPRVRSGTP
ncbi:MAG TPA: YihY/virulence factor BrkB family protein [Xanthobacteraceae bacterium]|nr:YihY/virulence factor BrkB family protein [Xanthobacteraceae bacterium]